jgi:hypothetical protein
MAEMSISAEAKSKFQLAPAFHFTLLTNLPNIIEKWALLSKNRVGDLLRDDLSNLEIQRARSERIVAGTNRSLHDFVPLYFGLKTPMLALKQARNEEIIQLRFPLEILGIPGACFSDGNARDVRTKLYEFRSVDDLSVLDAKAINGVSWGKDEEKKRRKQSEILVPDSLSLDYLIDIICFSESAGQNVKTVLQRFGKNLKVGVRPGFYFRESRP